MTMWVFARVDRAVPATKMADERNRSVSRSSARAASLRITCANRVAGMWRAATAMPVERRLLPIPMIGAPVPAIFPKPLRVGSGR